MTVREKVKKFIEENSGYIEAKRNEEGFRWSKIAKKIGVDEELSEYIRGSYKNWRERNPVKLVEGYTERRNSGGEIEITEIVPNRLTDAQLYDRYKRDPKAWKIKNVWYKEQTNGIKLSVNFVPLDNVQIDFTGEFKRFLSTYQPKEFEFSFTKKVEPVMAMISLADIHIGKEQGKLYFPLLLHGIANMISIAKSDQLDELIILNTGDLFHVDNVNGTTTKGTQMEYSLDFESSFTLGLDLITSILDMAKSMLPETKITFVNVRGNHDYSVSYCLGEAITALYKKDQQIKILNGKSNRIYYYWNNNAFLFTHGDKAVDRLPLIFATEGTEVFAKSAHRHIYIGHFHYNNNKKFLTDQNEDLGIQLRILASPSKTDTWHKVNGYIGNTKPITMLMYNKDEGKFSETTRLIT